MIPFQHRISIVMTRVMSSITVSVVTESVTARVPYCVTMYVYVYYIASSEQRGGKKSK